ncbi:MAG: multidrug efflux SMR transporter [Phycisphaeraceae bacterium]
MPYLYLAIAIVAEVVATSMLKATQGFTKPIASIVVIVGYCVAFYCLSITLRTMSVGVAYAIWCGVGMVLVTAVAVVAYQQKPDAWAIVGMGLIIAGVLVLNLMSNTVTQSH